MTTVIPLTPWGAGPPRAIPRVGSVLYLGPADWRFNTAEERHLVVEVVRVRRDISRWYGGDWVWVDGTEHSRPHPQTGRRLVSVLVRCAAIPQESRDREYQPRGVAA